MEKEKALKPFHFPGSNYTGPGTRITTNILNGVEPKTEIDKIARQHDIDYINNQSFFGGLKADAKAIEQAIKTKTTLESLAMLFGLTTRMIVNTMTLDNMFSFNKDNYNLDPKQRDILVEFLNNQIKIDENKNYN